MEIKLISLEEFNSFKSKVYNDLEELKNLLKSKGQNKKWMKSSEVRELLGISHGTLQTLRNNGSFQYSKRREILDYDITDITGLFEDNKTK